MQDIINNVKLMKYIRDSNIMKNNITVTNINTTHLTKIQRNKKYYNL